jgi:polysaccharide biosynthesis/export protein
MRLIKTPSLEHETMRTTLGRIGLWLIGLLTLGVLGSAPAMAEGRTLTTSDVVVIKVTGQPDLDTTTRVEPDGTINFPYVGRIRAAGRSEDALARTIEQRLAARQIVTEPHVLVETTGFGTQASVQGQVGAPGVYALDRQTNLTQLLARAGGLRETSGTVVIKRHGSILRYNGKDVVSGVVNGDKIIIQNNDEVYVDLAQFFWVYGFVGHPGEFQLIHPLTVQEAISVAGGLAALGSESRMWIKRKQADGQTIEVPASLDDQVEPHDTIIVNERIF